MSTLKLDAYAKAFAAKGGKARWAKLTDQEISEQMSEIAKKPRKKRAKQKTTK